MVDQDALYEIGYGKPPRKNRFQKGAPANPKGRPRGAKNLATIVLKESRQTVLVNGPRGSRKVTKIEAAMMQLGNKSAQGDLRATREFVALIQRSEESATSSASGIPLNELDLKTLEGLRRRVSSFPTEPTKTEEEKSE